MPFLLAFCVALWDNLVCEINNVNKTTTTKGQTLNYKQVFENTHSQETQLDIVLHNTFDFLTHNTSHRNKVPASHMLLFSILMAALYTITTTHSVLQLLLKYI